MEQQKRLASAFEVGGLSLVLYDVTITGICLHYFCFSDWPSS